MHGPVTASRAIWLNTSIPNPVPHGARRVLGPSSLLFSSPLFTLSVTPATQAPVGLLQTPWASRLHPQCQNTGLAPRGRLGSVCRLAGCPAAPSEVLAPCQALPDALCLLLILHDPRPGSPCQPTEAQESQMAWHHHQEGADLGFMPGHWLQSVLFSPCVISWCMEGRLRPEKRGPSGPQGWSTVHLSSGPSSLLPR